MNLTNFTKLCPKVSLPLLRDFFAAAWRSAVAITFLIVLTLASSCSGLNGPIPPDKEPTNQRVLSITAIPRLEPPPTRQDFIDALNLAYDAGARGQHISYRWSQLEPAEGVYDIQKLIDKINLVTTLGFKETQLTIVVLNTTVKETPPDLQGVSFNSRQMKDRFRALIDVLRPHLTERVVYLSIGNEVDIYLAAHPDEFLAYKDFYEDALAYVHQIAPWIKVGVTVTFIGATGPEASNVAVLTASSDVYILTYYPRVNPEFNSRDPQSPMSDFPRMVDLAGDRTVVLQEVGYPSATVLSSSEDEQAEFVSNVFKAWQAVGSRIRFLNYFLLYDFSETKCDDLLNYYGLFYPNFKAFLCSLGLRRVDGVPKLGWQAFLDAATGLPN